MRDLSISKKFTILLSTTIAVSVLYGCRKHEKATTEPPAKVEVSVVGNTAAGTGARSYSGTAESAEASTVSFSVPGTITKIYVEVGQQVARGQLLARIKDESLHNARNIAQAELDEARDAYQRLKKLHDANALPDIKWVEVQSKLKQAENAAALANRAVGDAALHSPISGYVSEKFSDDGQTVIAAQPVLKIVNLKEMWISISVPEEEIASFGSSTTATVTLDGLDSLSVQGKLSQKAVVADPFTRSYTVRFSIPNPDNKILPGMIGTVVVDGAPGAAGSVAAATSFILPAQSVLLSSDNRQFVWVVENGKAIRKFVTADEFASEGVRVRSGLVAGDSVIVAGMQKVSTGTEVSVTNPKH